MARSLSLAQLLGRREEEARARHRLGLALWAQGDIAAAASQLERSAAMLEALRREMKEPDSRLALFDLQTACYQALQVRFNLIIIFIKTISILFSDL